MKIYWRRGVDRLLCVTSVLVSPVVAYLQSYEYAIGGGKQFNLSVFILGSLILMPAIFGCLLLIKVATIWIISGFTKPPK